MRKLIVFLLFCFPTPFIFGADIILKAGLPAFPPFADPSLKNTQKGSVTNLYKMLEKELGVKIKIKYDPYARVLKNMKTGEMDLAIIFKNQSLKRKVNYIGKISLSRVVILFRKGKSIKRYEDLYRFRSIAILHKANFQKRFDRDKKLKKHSVSNYSQAIKMLRLGRVDAAVGSVWSYL
ncbi:MAG: polar amino acid transport system substrate-binding protein [bacterium]|jgi:polar amino acid transport system substrate-binding protein